MDLKDLQRQWHSLGKRDPFYAVLTFSRFKDNRWNAEEFFKTGETGLDKLLERLKKLGVAPGWTRCLDFGCGVGRLTQALCKHFESCDGVDIAPSMIELANKYNRYGERCRYHLNERDDLRMFPDASFDFVCSLLVLQHMEPDYAKGYIREFLRILKPGAIAAFHLPYNGPKRRTLPDAAHRARIRMKRKRLKTYAAQPLTLKVVVGNASEVRWPEHATDADEFGRLRLGNHWLDRNGGRLLWDDGRTRLPGALNPGQEVKLRLTITPPEQAGDYLLELDLVEEGVTWFADRGSDAPRVEVHNRPANSGLVGRVRAIFQSLAGRQDGPGSAKPGFEGKASNETGLGEEDVPALMEMYCIPKQEVVDLVAESGGRILDQSENDWCGDRFDSALYIAERSAQSWP